MIKEEGLYQNEVNFSHVSTRNCRMDQLQINEKSKIWQSVSFEARKGSKKIFIFNQAKKPSTGQNLF